MLYAGCCCLSRQVLGPETELNNRRQAAGAYPLHDCSPCVPASRAQSSCALPRCRYLGAELREPENSDWKAAGVLVYTFNRDGELLMLLGRPDYSALPQGKRRDTWNLLGAPTTQATSSLHHAAVLLGDAHHLIVISSLCASVMLLGGAAIPQ